MALMSYIEYATTEDGSRYNWHHYSIIFQRKWHLFKGRNTIYVLELDGKKHLLFNGGYMSLNSNLTQIDIKISKKWLRALNVLRLDCVGPRMNLDTLLLQ